MSSKRDILSTIYMCRGYVFYAPSILSSSSA